MKNISFLVWMLLFPITDAIYDYISSRVVGYKAPNHSVNVQGFSALMNIIIWIAVGICLYE